MGAAVSTPAHTAATAGPPHQHDSIHARLAHQLQHTHVAATPSTPLTVGVSSAELTPAAAADPTLMSKPARQPCACAHLHPGKSCLSYVVSSFGRSFYLAYGIRAGISLALHLIKLLRGPTPLKVFDLNELVSAHGLPIDAVRMGLFMGGFTGIYNGIRCMLARLTGKDNPYTVMGAGTVAGLSILFQNPDSHRTLALYVWARVFQWSV
jgi:hypothetical protein